MHTSPDKTLARRKEATGFPFFDNPASRYGAGEAQRMGLVNAVVPAAELESTVRSGADTMAENAPLSILKARRIVDELMKDPAVRDTKL